MTIPSMGKKQGEHKQYDADDPVPASTPQITDTVVSANAAPLPKMKRKEYEREMRLLHGELVAMQEWVKASRAKLCIVCLQTTLSWPARHHS